MSLKQQQTRGRFPVPGLLRRDKRRSEPVPPATFSFCLFISNTDGCPKQTDLSPLSEEQRATHPAPQTHRGIAGDSWTWQEFRFPGWSWKGDLPWQALHAQEAPALSPRGWQSPSLATLLSLIKGGRRKCRGQEGTRRPEVPLGWASASRDTKTMFLPCVVTVDCCAWAVKTIPEKSTLQEKIKERNLRRFPSGHSQTSSEPS